MIVGEVSALTFPVISFCELLPSKLEMMKMAALLTDAFNLIMWCGFFFWKGDRLLSARTLCTAGFQGQGLFLVYATSTFLLGFIAVLYLPLASCAECHNLLTVCFLDKVK